MADAHIKRPSDVIDVQFDFLAFVAAVGLEGVSPIQISFFLRTEPGLTIASSMETIGLVKLRVGSGVMGRVYDLGVEATTPDGDSAVQMTKVRVRDPSLFEILDSTTEVTIVPPAGAATWDAGATWNLGTLWS